jgi:hypothetical protein
MSIFEKRKPTGFTEEKKVVGAYVPLPLIEYLSLYAMYIGESKAYVIEQQIIGLKSRLEREGLNVDFLLDAMASKAVVKYYKDKRNDPKFKRGNFLVKLRMELQNMPIRDEFKQQLIEKIENGTKKES